MVLAPKSVADYITNFTVALAQYFNTEDPGRTESYYLIDAYVFVHSKRSIVLYIAHAPLATARKITRIHYVMPVNALYAHLFHEEGLVASEGPLIHTFDVPAEYPTAVGFVNAIVADSLTGPANRRMATWVSEMTRVRGIANTPEESFVRRSNATKILNFWTPLQTSIMGALRHVNIHVPDAAGHLPGPWRSPATSVSPANAPAPAMRTSSGTRRRRSEERRRRLSSIRRRHAPRRKSTSDPDDVRVLGYRIDPVTGKVTRRRRPNSDPKDD
jgi:hypothetical protein